MEHTPYSDEYLRAINYARAEAVRLQNTIIGPEHLFLGMLHEDTGTCKKYLNTKNTGSNSYESWIRKTIQNNYRREEDLYKGPVFNEVAYAIINNAIVESEKEKSSEVKLHHLFLAILKQESTLKDFLSKKYNADYVSFHKYLNTFSHFEVSFGDPRLKKSYTPVSLYFDLNEFSKDEIAEVISYLSDIYNEISDDELEIVGTQKLEFSRCLEPVYA